MNNQVYPFYEEVFICKEKGHKSLNFKALKLKEKENGNVSWHPNRV